MNALILRLCCGWAAIAGEPGCDCDRPDAIEVRSSGDRREWWNLRMRQRSDRDLRAIRSLGGDRPRARRALVRHALDHGRTFVHRRINRVPLWWQWSQWLTAAMVAEIMVQMIDRRGGLYRDRG